MATEGVALQRTKGRSERSPTKTLLEVATSVTTFVRMGPNQISRTGEWAARSNADLPCASEEKYIHRIWISADLLVPTILKSRLLHSAPSPVS